MYYVGLLNKGGGLHKVIGLENTCVYGNSADLEVYGAGRLGVDSIFRL